MTKQLLIIAHSPSPNTLKLRDALVRGASSDEINQIEVICKAPLDTQPEDVLSADGIILFTPENLAYMSGAMKDFFDRCYYPVLEEKQGLPVAVVIRAGHDGTGTHRALKTILTGLKWRWVQEAMICRGDWQEGFVDQCEELGMAMAVGLEAGII